MTITCHRKTVPLSFHVNSWARNMSDDSNLQKASGPKAPGWFTQPLPESGRRWWFSGCDQFQIPALSFISSAPSERCVRRPDLGETKNDETGSNIEENRDMNSWDITWWFYHQPKYVNVHKNHTQSSFICACMDIQIYIYIYIHLYLHIYIHMYCCQKEWISRLKPRFSIKQCCLDIPWQFSRKRLGLGGHGHGPMLPRGSIM